MKIRLERDALTEAVSWVARSLPSRPPVTVLGGVLLDAGAGEQDGDDHGGAGLRICAFDYEISATADVAATVADPGRVLVSGRLLAEITKTLPDQPVDISVDGSRATISCGSAKFSLPTMPVEDYPRLPEQPALAGEVAGDAFGHAVAQVAVAAGKDDTLPMLTGLRVEISGSTLTLVATDRFRLAMREFPWEPVAELPDSAVLVPARTLAEAAKTLGSAGSTLRLALGSGEGMLGLSSPQRRATTRLLDADFPPYRKLLPEEHTARAVVDVAALAEAIKRVALVAEKGAQVRLSFTDGSVHLAAGGDDQGSAEEELPVEFTGEDLTIAFNPGYLSDGLAAVHAGRAELTFTTPGHPAVIKPAQDDGTVLEGYLYLLMPVRLPG